MNFIDFVFINFIFVITILGMLINLSEPYLPIIILQTFRYGKHSYKGVPSKLVQLCEIPKSYFKHFYLAAIFWSTLALYLVVNAYLLGYKVPQLIINILDLLCGEHREVKSNSTASFVAVSLLVIQCFKRFYETHFVQVFGSTSRMNITHYIVGHLHYSGAFITIFSRADGFVKESNQMPLSFNQLNLTEIIGTFLFLFSCYHQYQSNQILANLRKNKSGKIVTEKHLLPEGGYFDYVSSPHMLFEVLMYAGLCMILQHNISIYLVFLWVLTNQVENAWLTHKWYMNTFKEYSAKKKAIFPGLL